MTPVSTSATWNSVGTFGFWHRHRPNHICHAPSTIRVGDDHGHACTDAQKDWIRLGRCNSACMINRHSPLTNTAVGVGVQGSESEAQIPTEISEHLLRNSQDANPPQPPVALMLSRCSPARFHWLPAIVVHLRRNAAEQLWGNHLQDGSDQRNAQRDRRLAPTSYLPLGPSLDPFSFPRQ